MIDFALSDPFYISEREISGTPGFAPTIMNGTSDETAGDFQSLAITLGSMLFEEKCFWNSFFKSQKNNIYKQKLPSGK